MNSSAYNHNRLGTDEKPLISNVDFKLLVDAIKAGNSQACKEIISRYTLSNFQQELLKQMGYEL